MNTWTKEQLEEMFGDNVIQQLAFLAGCTKHSYSDPKNPELDGFIVSQATLDKFAELIVKECIKITRPDTGYPNEGNDWEQGFHVGKEDAADYIQEHFGVE